MMVSNIIHNPRIYNPHCDKVGMTVNAETISQTLCADENLAFVAVVKPQ